MSSMDRWTKIGYTTALGALIVFSLIELSISAWLISRFNSHSNYRTQTQLIRTRYILFTSCWTAILTVPYLILFLLAPTGLWFTGVISNAIFLFISWALWLAAAAAITHYFGGSLNCGYQNSYVYCGQNNALIGFAWLIWVLLTLMLLFVISRGISSARRGEGKRGGLIENPQV